MECPITDDRSRDCASAYKGGYIRYHKQKPFIKGVLWVHYRYNILLLKVDYQLLRKPLNMDFFAIFTEPEVLIFIGYMY